MTPAARAGAKERTVSTSGELKGATIPATPIADRVTKHLAASGRQADDESFARGAFLVLLAAEPTAKELAACSRALDEWRKLPEAGSGAAATAFARANLVWVLFNHNDFVTIR